MNTPYVKQYDENGIVTNPIKGAYISEFENRKKRREPLQKQRFHGNGKNYPLTIAGKYKYLRRKQAIECVDKKTGEFTGEIRIIEHYTPI